MTIDDIHAMQEQYVQAVVNAKSAGFDAVTFHAAHGNIMPEFFSTLYNKRTDWYGGSLENRVRFAREIVEMARKAVGPAYPLIMRISGDKVVIIGGGATGCESAEFFGAQEYELNVHRLNDFAGDLDITVTHNDKFHNKDVTIVEMMPELGIGMGDFEKRILFATLKENGVKSMVNTKVWNIDDGVVRVVDKNRGDVVELPADTVILAGGLRPTSIDTSNVTIPVYSIGDADRPGRIINALLQAYCTAREF